MVPRSHMLSRGEELTSTLSTQVGLQTELPLGKAETDASSYVCEKGRLVKG